MPTTAKPARDRVRTGRKATATRARILDAAATVFRQNGYTGTRLSDIASAANTQAGSMYYHFASREDLVREVLRVAQERTNEFVMERVHSLPEDASSLDRLREALTAHLTAVLEIGDYTAATLRILGQVPEEIRESIVGLRREYGKFFKQLFDQALANGELRADLDPYVCRMFVLGAMNASPEWFHPHQPDGLTVLGLAEQFDRIFLSGIGTAKGNRRRPRRPAVEIPEPAPAAPAETRAAATIVRILDSAAKVFRENGYAGARLADIAAQADMQTGSLYYHFDSREDLVTHLLRSAWEHLDDAVRTNLDALPGRATPITRLSTVMTAHLLAVLSEGHHISALLRIQNQVPEEVLAPNNARQRTTIDLWRGLLKDAFDSGDIKSGFDLPVVLMVLFGALNWTVEWYEPGRHLEPLDLAEQFCTLAFEGMAASGPSRR